QAEPHAARYAGLVNAVLRRVTREGRHVIAGLDTAALDTPQWLWARWEKTYGAETAHAIAAANAQEPALDLTVKNDPDYWADALGGGGLATRSVPAVVHWPAPQM